MRALGSGPGTGGLPPRSDLGSRVGPGLAPPVLGAQGNPPGTAGSNQRWPRGQGDRSGLHGASETGPDATPTVAAPGVERGGPQTRVLAGVRRRLSAQAPEAPPTAPADPAPRCEATAGACVKQVWGGRWELYSPEASAPEGFSKDLVRGPRASDGPGHGLGRSAPTTRAPRARIWAGSGRRA